MIRIYGARRWLVQRQITHAPDGETKSVLLSHYDVGSVQATLESRGARRTKLCLERWGLRETHHRRHRNEARVCGHDLSDVSRGKDVLFEAMRVRELEEFFDDLSRSSALNRSRNSSCAPV